MSEIITDTYEFTVAVAQQGDLAIQNVIAPAKIAPGVDFVVSYDVVNNGGTDTCWGHIVDTSSGREIPGTKWQQSIVAGARQHFENTLTGGPTDLNAKIEAGYYTP